MINMEQMKLRRLVLGAFCLLLTSLMTGCASTPDYQYYRLNTEIPEATSTTTKAVYTLGITPVVLPNWMDSELLAWNEGTYNIRRLEFDRWG